MSGPVSEPLTSHGRPSLDTEAVSADEATAEGGFNYSGEIQVNRRQQGCLLDLFKKDHYVKSFFLALALLVIA